MSMKRATGWCSPCLAVELENEIVKLLPPSDRCLSGMEREELQSMAPDAVRFSQAVQGQQISGVLARPGAFNFLQGTGPAQGRGGNIGLSI